MLEELPRHVDWAPSLEASEVLEARAELGAGKAAGEGRIVAEMLRELPWGVAMVVTGAIQRRYAGDRGEHEAGLTWKHLIHRFINKVNKLTSLWGGRAVEVFAPSQARRRSMNPTRAWLRTNQHLRTFATEQLRSWESIPEPLSEARLKQFVDEVEAGRLGIRERLPSVLIRLLTVRAWDKLYGASSNSSPSRN